ncbi:UDP:flavonoid glycosyltransferase YjiC (YdhE family) [Kutzneria viridogrisea]|uniref:UDP:flavonoid glycosyltransferase YjiC (YdhE family) n=1 Tax=Kutzneria viridogrisea TaxID=47990 RepID=A0ABR6BAD2_9PSEU|nr:UDP:flavonoid glycosyltransferase YjiC (YdhE family) [Kutzneria viridogrisea]
MAWAVRAAGHDVLLATAGGGVPVAAATGLPVAKVADDEELLAAHKKVLAAAGQREFDQMVSDAIQADDVHLAIVITAVSCAATVDGTVAVAEQWRPDLLVYDGLQQAAPLVAGKLGIPVVAHGFGLISDQVVAGIVRDTLQDAYQRHGATYPTRCERIDILPQSLQGDGLDGWPVRYMSYHGGGVLPEWVLRRPARPRIAVTMGTTVEDDGKRRWLRGVLAAAGELDAEFVCALGETSTPLPDNAFSVGWVPMNELLAHCDAVVHHGGSGSTLAALAAGIPQLIVPVGPAYSAHAVPVAQRGTAMVRELAEVDQECLRRLLEDTAMRTAAGEVAAEMYAMPAPASIVPELERLVTTGGGRTLG